MNSSVDVLVPIHSETRPLARLISSVLSGTEASVRVLVIAHNIAEERIAAAAGRWLGDARVDILPFADGVKSPAGPLAFALTQVTAPFFTKIDSDDHLAPAAIDGWLARQERTSADIVLPVMRYEDAAASFPTPPTRPGRRSRLDPVRDRLAYRSSTMGLIRSDLAALAVPTAGLSTGEDIAPSLRLWFSGARISRAGAAARYVVGGAAGDRVTAEDRSLGDELAFLAPLAAEEWLSALPADARRSIALKLARVQLFDAVARRSDRAWSDSEAGAAVAAVAALSQISGDYTQLLSRIDSEIVRRIASDDTLDEVRKLVGLRRRYLTPPALATARARDILRRDAPLRFLAASVLASRAR